VINVVLEEQRSASARAVQTFKDAASLLVWTKANFESFGFRVFVGDVIFGVGLGLFGRSHQALDPNRKSQFLTLVFSRKKAII